MLSVFFWTKGLGPRATLLFLRSITHSSRFIPCRRKCSQSEDRKAVVYSTVCVALIVLEEARKTLTQLNLSMKKQSKGSGCLFYNLFFLSFLNFFSFLFVCLFLQSFFDPNADFSRVTSKVCISLLYLRI